MTINRRDFIGSCAGLVASGWLPVGRGVPEANAQHASGSAFDMAAFNPAFPAPPFNVVDLAGREHQIGRRKSGKFILLNFWATWCPPCVRELPSLERAMNLIGANRFVVLAISVDKHRDAHKIAKFRDKYALTFPIVHDAKSKIADMYGTHQFPTTFLVDPGGNVVAAAKGERDWHSESAIAYFNEVISRYENS